MYILSYRNYLERLLCRHLQFSSVTLPCPTLSDPMDCSTPGLLSITSSRSLLKLMSIESVMPSNHLILCRPLLPPAIYPSIRVFFFQMNQFFPSVAKVLGFQRNWSCTHHLAIMHCSRGSSCNNHVATIYWSRDWSCTEHVIDPALITWLIMNWSRDCSSTYHLTDHALITWLIKHVSRDWSCTDHVTIMH